MRDSMVEIRSSSWNWRGRRALGSHPGRLGQEGELLADVEMDMKFRGSPLESGKTPDRKVARPRKGADAGIDEWVTRRLHDAFDPVLDERIPEDLDRLLNDFAKRPTGKKD